MSEVVLKVEKLTKNYGAYRAVDSVSFEIRRGEVLGLLGPNGAGKTTTIQMLVGITNMSAGKISYFGNDFMSHKQASLQRINSTSAYNTLLGRITVRENLTTFAGLYQVADKKAKIAEMLDKFEVSHLANNRYQDLSAGERTRVNLAKSLLNDPELVLMDEPTASLDPDIADKTLGSIEQLRSDHQVSILFTSHNMSEVERICDNVIFLDKGKVASRGAPADHTKRFNYVELNLTFKGSQDKLANVLNNREFDFEFTDNDKVQIETTKDKSAELIAGLVNDGFNVLDLDVKQPDLTQVFIDIARNKK